MTITEAEKLVSQLTVDELLILYALISSLEQKHRQEAIDRMQDSPETL